jgi:hypothetical protein
MFSNVVWTAKNTNTLIADLGPGQCHVDVIGNANDPALEVGKDPGDPNYIYFRIRLVCDPRTSAIELRNSVWGVVIKDLNGTPLYTVRVNSKPNERLVEVYTANTTNPFVAKPAGCPGEVIVIGDLGNVQIIADGSNFYLEFKAPIACFSPSGFFNDINNYIYCAFTSENDNNINKEIPPPYPPHGDVRTNNDLCGGQVIPTVGVDKSVIPDRVLICTGTPVTYTVRITVTANRSDLLPLNITVTDVLNTDFMVTSGPTPPPPFTGTLTVDNPTVTFEYTVTGSFPAPGLYQFNTATVTETGTGRFLGFDNGPNIRVLDCRGLQFS